MSTLEGGCQVPIGAYARIEGDALVMEGIVGSVDGTRILRARVEGDPGDPAALGHELVDKLLALGAAEILAEVRDTSVAPGPVIDARLET
jgi:hydroxymethylbilane synthase